MHRFAPLLADAAPTGINGFLGTRASLMLDVVFLAMFAVVPALAFSIAVVGLALRRFPSPPQPCAHSELHKKLGWLATLGMTFTAVTGWVFYWLAFVAG